MTGRRRCARPSGGYRRNIPTNKYLDPRPGVPHLFCPLNRDAGGGRRRKKPAATRGDGLCCTGGSEVSWCVRASVCVPLPRNRTRAARGACRRNQRNARLRLARSTVFARLLPACALTPRPSPFAFSSFSPSLFFSARPEGTSAGIQTSDGSTQSLNRQWMMDPPQGRNAPLSPYATGQPAAPMALALLSRRRTPKDFCFGIARKTSRPPSPGPGGTEPEQKGWCWWDVESVLGGASADLVVDDADEVTRRRPPIGCSARLPNRREGRVPAKDLAPFLCLLFPDGCWTGTPSSSSRP